MGTLLTAIMIVLNLLITAVENLWGGRHYDHDGRVYLFLDPGLVDLWSPFPQRDVTEISRCFVPGRVPGCLWRNSVLLRPTVKEASIVVLIPRRCGEKGLYDSTGTLNRSLA